jgi:hypothetical protein
MAKELPLDKVKKIFEKQSIHKQLDLYEALGIWLHNIVQAHRDTLAQENEALKSLQEKLHTKNEGA